MFGRGETDEISDCFERWEPELAIAFECWRGRLIGTKKYLAAAVLTVWLITIAFFMAISRTLDLEIFFVLSLIGLLVIVVLIDGAFSRPRYMRSIGYLIAAGVAQKILEILAA